LEAIKPHSLRDLARCCGGEVVGDDAITIQGVGTLDGAGPTDIAFLTNTLYRDRLKSTRAAAVILAPVDRDATSLPRIISLNPYASYARIAQALYPQSIATPGVHATAVIHPSVHIPASAQIGPNVVLEEGVMLGERVVIGAGTTLADNVSVGADSLLYPRVTVYAECQLGERSIVHSGVVIGADGFGMAWDQGAWVKIPQVGRVVIGCDVEIGANTTIDRGTIEDTVVEDGVKLDNQIQIAHNCRIGAHTVIAGCAGLSGSTKIGRHCRIGGGVGIVGHVELCDGVTVSGFSLITKSITQPGIYTSSIPSEPHRSWLTTLAHLRALPEWLKRLKIVEQDLKKIKKGTPWLK
jgi:UDP-3-O-[3-hydroxymyristoyl] glucosamine N-acyltransferase